LTLTFKLVRARDQTRLPCEFSENPFSGSRDIFHTQTKKSQTALKTEPYLCAVTKRALRWLTHPTTFQNTDKVFTVGPI